MLPDPIKKFIHVFSRLPSIGPRQATRLAFYLTNLGKDSIAEMAEAVYGLKDLKCCPECFLTIHGQCPICYDSSRRKDIVAIVEKETDLMSLEKTGKFRGIYLVLGDLGKTGMLDPEQKLKINHLKSRAPLEEIILAINPTAYGDINAGLIAQELRGCAKKISRLGRGIPTGGEIEFADEDTLGSALDNRG